MISRSKHTLYAISSMLLTDVTPMLLPPNEGWASDSLELFLVMLLSLAIIFLLPNPSS